MKSYTSEEQKISRIQQYGGFIRKVQFSCQLQLYLKLFADKDILTVILLESKLLSFLLIDRLSSL